MAKTLLQTYCDHTEEGAWAPGAVGQMADPAVLVVHAAEPCLRVLCVSPDQLQPLVVLLTGGVEQHVHLLRLRVQLPDAGTLCKHERARAERPGSEQLSEKFTFSDVSFADCCISHILHHGSVDSFITQR